MGGYVTEQSTIFSIKFQPRFDAKSVFDLKIMFPYLNLTLTIRCERLMNKIKTLLYVFLQRFLAIKTIAIGVHYKLHLDVIALKYP